MKDLTSFEDIDNLDADGLNTQTQQARSPVMTKQVIS
jgi:hypothetical protein